MLDKKLIFSHLFVHNYFRCKEQIIKLQTYKDTYKTFCSLCFEPICEHNTVVDKYEDATGQLKIWCELNLAYGKDKFLIREQGLPSFPSTGFNEFTDYIAKPILDLPLSIVSVKINGGEKIAYFEDGKINEKLINYAYDSRFGDGIWYGYFDNKKFYSLTLFKGNRFINTTRHNLPYKNLDRIENIKFNMGVGVWYLPQVKHYHQFHRYLQKYED